MKNQLRKRKDIEFIGNIFSKQLVETEMNYANNSISKIENFDIEVIKNKFLNENKICCSQKLFSLAKDRPNYQF